MRDIRDNIFSAFVAGYGVAVVIHLLGLLLMSRVKFKPLNQRILIIHLAFVELLFNLYQLHVYIFWMKYRWDPDSTSGLVDRFFFLFLATANKLIMIYLICDRLLDIHLHLRYPIYFTEQRVKNINIVIWLFSAMYALIMTVLIKVKIGGGTLLLVCYLFYLGKDLVIVISALVTYGYLYMKVRHFRAIDNSHRNLEMKSKIRVSNRSKFLLPCLIIATYLVFNITAIVMYLYKTHLLQKGLAKSLVSEISHWFWIFGHISDGVLYIFLQKDVKKKLISIFGKRQVSPASGQ